MSNNKQSSVEWFAEQTLNAFITKEKYDELLEQAKAMHKEEILDAWDKGDYCIDSPDGTWEQKYKSGEQYYNEIYGGNNEQN